MKLERRNIQSVSFVACLLVSIACLDGSQALVPSRSVTRRGIARTSLFLSSSSSPKDLPLDQYDMEITNDYRYSASDWIHNIKTLPKSTILREIRGMTCTVVGWSAFVSLVHKALLATKGSDIANKMCIPSMPHSFLVSSLSLLLVFKTNSAYQRFAEGRRIWEQIHSISRSTSRMVTVYEGDLGTARKQRVFRLLAAFPYLLKQHIQPSGILDQTDLLGGNALILYEPVKQGMRGRALHARNLVNGGTIQKYCVDKRCLPWCLLPPKALRRCAESNNRPLWVCDRLAQEPTHVPYSNNFTSRERLTFLSSVSKLSQCIGECERIHQTAVPQNYARHSLRSLTIWLFSLPFGMVKDLGFLTAPVMGLIAWLLLGIYQIGFEIEDPFTGSLRLQVLCDAIYRDMLYGLNPLESSNVGVPAAG
jgi:predicted membrane chloride channel (bestrophin family)